MKNKIFLSVLVICIAILATLPYIDNISYENHNQAFNRSIAAFAIAKSLNAIISALQGTEIGVSFIANATLSVGELLDPLNDMIERFSWIMLVSSIALGIEKLLMGFISVDSVKIFFIVVSIFTLISIWLPKKSLLKDCLFKFFLILTLIRFIIPITEGLNTMVYNNFTSQTYENANKSLKQANIELNDIKNELSTKELSFFETILNKFEKTSQDMLNLMIIFIFQTMILPIFTLWICYKSIVFLLKKDIILYKN